MDESWADVFDSYIKDYLRGVHTFKPARITAVNDSNVNAQILTKTKYKSGKQVPQSDVYNVPLFVLSANMGKAKITMPVKRGDLVLIGFSDRDIGILQDTKGDQPVDSESIYTHTYEPIIALAGWFTHQTSIPVDTENIVIENDGSRITVSPDGDVTIKSNGNFNVEFAEKMALGQEGGDELLQLFVDLIDLLIQSTTSTMLGPQPLSIAASDLPDLKAKLEEIKGSL